MNLHEGSLLQGGRYRIEKVLGQGGFGITYLGVQTNLEAKVAIKEFFMKDLCNRDSNTSQVTVGSVGSRETVDSFRQKFIKEARNIFRLKHRHIIPVIDVFEENGTAYYVMEHIGGGSLADKVRGGALPEEEAVRYTRQVADALDFVHSKRMMHLDVKPANILLDDNDNAVLIDFGLAKQYDTEGHQTSSTPVGISHGYAPLEQYKRGGVSTFSPATDIYSLGATLFKLVTGITPPEASDVNDEGLPVLPSDISPAVRATIEAAMQPRRKDRPQSIEEFLELLKDSKDPRASKDPNEETIAPKEPKDSKVSKDPNDDLISPDEVEITAVPNGYVNEETRVVTKDPKDPKDSKDSKVSKDPKEINTPKAPESINETIKGGLIAVVAVAVAVLLCVGIWWYVNDNSDGGYDSYSASSSSYTSYDDSNSDSNVDADAQRQREEEERIAREAEAQRLAEEQRAREEEEERIAREAEAQRLADEQRAREEAERLAREQQQGISTQKKVDLGLSVCWAGWNVGATSPEGYGNYYAWGEISTKSNYSESSYQYHNGSYVNIGSNISGTQYDVARAQWGGSWRMPTKAEFEELIDRCTWTWTSYNGVNGYKITGPNGRSIFLPAAGTATELSNRGVSGDYWSGSFHESIQSNAYYLSFYIAARYVARNARKFGYTVRPVSD